MTTDELISSVALAFSVAVFAFNLWVWRRTK